jgi:hypothetical protein
MDPAEQRALHELRALIEQTISEMEAGQDGFPLPWPVQKTIREYLARAFEAGRASPRPATEPSEPDGE